MFCRNCGNKLDSGVKFCSRCGTKNEIQIVQQMLNNKKDNVDSLKDNNPSFLLSNIIVLLLFIASMCLLFLGTVISLFKLLMDSSDSSGASGWFLIMLPVGAVMFVIPQYIGVILSVINLKIKNYKMLIFIFIASVFSILSTIFSYVFSDNNKILFWLCLIASIGLSIIVLLKLIFKIKK